MILGMQVVVSIEGVDEVQANLDEKGHIESVKIVGCHNLTETMFEMRQKHGNNITAWPVPTANDHVSMLIKELILKLQNRWQYPFEGDEVCHCRSVSTATIDKAILLGAHTPEEVSQATNASTSCGTCRSDVEKIINYRKN
ncbi:MAG: (2Fe-2S)-binding protein [Bdellovibrionia bacterium]